MFGEISNDRSGGMSHARDRSPFSVLYYATGTSGGAFAEIACVFGMDVSGVIIGTALTGIPLTGTAFTGISFGFGDTVCLSTKNVFLPVLPSLILNRNF